MMLPLLRVQSSQSAPLLTILILILLLPGPLMDAFSTTATTTRRRHHPSRRFDFDASFDARRRQRRWHISSSFLIILHQQPTSYGRDDIEKIWPPTNEKTVIRLADSLVVAASSSRTNDNNDEAIMRMDNNNDNSRQLLSYRKPLLWIVTLVYTMGKLMMTTTTTMPFDLLVLIAISGYFILIHRFNVLPTPSVNDRELLGLYDQPLGPMTNDAARSYETWDHSIGTYLGIILPVLCLLGTTTSGGNDVLAPLVTATLGRPVLFYCAQRLSEHFSMAATTPAVSLPLRALIPILYTAIRLLYYGYYCYHGTTLLDTTAAASAVVMSSSWTTPVVIITALLTVTNFLYASVHLFLVLPWVALRHLRIHCFLVEAESVQLRDESVLGLTPHSNSNNNNNGAPRRR
jgi:hypothetical protein